MGGAEVSAVRGGVAPASDLARTAIAQVICACVNFDFGRSSRYRSRKVVGYVRCFLKTKHPFICLFVVLKTRARLENKNKHMKGSLVL